MPSLEFYHKAVVRGFEKKEGKNGDYTLVVIEADAGRTIDVYHKGLIHLQKDTLYDLRLKFDNSYGKGQLSLLSVVDKVDVKK